VSHYNSHSLRITSMFDNTYKLPSRNTAQPNNPKNDWIILGSELSPFTLKVLNYFSYLGIPHRFLYTQGSTLENIGIQLRKTLLISGLKKLTCPAEHKDNEFPLVPFIFGPNGENMYDSSAVAHWLELHPQIKDQKTLQPSTDPKVRFLINLIDEYADEVGLYMVHHNRWKVAAKDNNAGARLGAELKSVAGPFAQFVDLYFSARQTRRLPYLFSVAESDFHIDGVKKSRQPPARDGFPATHQLLETAFSNLLNILESIFSARPYLFGERYTLADASLYGQLAMNLPDPAAARWIEQQSPATYSWLKRMAQLDFSSDNADSQAVWSDDLLPLLQEIDRFFVPLMEQNAQAMENYEAKGQALFNEKAFDRNQSLYDGEIDGMPFKSVAKTFQRKVWRDLQNQAQQLNQEDKNWLRNKMPSLSFFTL